MTEEDKKLAEQLSKELQESLENTFVGEVNSGVTKARVTAFLQGKINEWYEAKKLEFAPLPTIEVQIDGNMMTVNFFDPVTKEPLTWADWIERYSGRHYGRRD
jgi:hypothetical protein